MTDHDAPEAAAMLAHYAQPAARRPWLPEDVDALRDGLLKGWRAAREGKQ